MTQLPANQTPGKFDDILEASECFFLKMANVARYAKENYVDPDGTFQDIKLVEVNKWLPIIRYVTSSAQDIAEECFGKDAVPNVKSEIVRIILNFLGIQVDVNTAKALSFLSTSGVQ